MHRESLETTIRVDLQLLEQDRDVGTCFIFDYGGPNLQARVLREQLRPLRFPSRCTHLRASERWSVSRGYEVRKVIYLARCSCR